MSVNTVEDFVKMFLKSLCRKFSLENEDETSVVDSFCNELLEFSGHFQECILVEICKIPAQLITSEELSVHFLDSVFSNICGLEDTVAIKFFVLCAFITILTTLSCMIPCYRLVQSAQMVLAYKFKTKLPLNDVKSEFETLEESNLRLTVDEHWFVSRLHQWQQFIQKASDLPYHGLKKQPDVASRIKITNEMKTHTQKSEGGAIPSEDETCPFCESNCKTFLKTLLN